jgi:NTE family protein
MTKKYKTGLCLSGGGIRGLAHLGTVKALNENGYTIDIIAGTSMGAIMGLFLADGYTPDEVQDLLKNAKRSTFIKRNITKGHLLSYDGLKVFLKQNIRANSFENLKIPLVVAATDINNGRIQYFSKGTVIDKVLASASIPIIFPPVHWNNTILVDGGLLENLPARAIREQTETIIGVNVNPRCLGLEKGTPKNMLQLAERAFHVAMYSNTDVDRSLCDIYIEHFDLNEYSLLDFRKMKKIVDVGYNYAKLQLAK